MCCIPRVEVRRARRRCVADAAARSCRARGRGHRGRCIASGRDGGRRAGATSGRRVGVGGHARSIWLVEVDRRRRGRRPVQPSQPAILGLADQRRRRRARVRSTPRSTPRSSATASPAGSTVSSPSTSPSSACRTGRPAGCSPAAACCRATRCTPFACEPRSATTPCIVDGRFPARASTDGWLAVGRLPGQRLSRRPARPIPVWCRRRRNAGTPRRPNRPRRGAGTTAPTTSATPSTGPTDTSTPGETTAPANPGGRRDRRRAVPIARQPGHRCRALHVALDYDPTRNKLSATAHLDIAITEDRNDFTLDSDGPDVSAVTIDGVAGTVRRGRRPSW